MALRKIDHGFHLSNPIFYVKKLALENLFKTFLLESTIGNILSIKRVYALGF